MKFTISLLAFVFMTGLYNAKAQTTLSDPEVAAVAVAANQIDIKYGEIAIKKSKNELKKIKVKNLQSHQP